MSLEGMMSVWTVYESFIIDYKRSFDPRFAQKNLKMEVQTFN